MYGFIMQQELYCIFINMYECLHISEHTTYVVHAECIAR